MKRARLVIAEDYEPTQYILRWLLEPYYDVVAVVDDGRALLEAVEEHHPAVALLDVSMPVLSGVATAKQLKGTHPEVKILFVSAHAETIYKEEAFRLGAAGYLVKNDLERELVAAVDSIVSGGSYGLSEFNPNQQG